MIPHPRHPGTANPISGSTVLRLRAMPPLPTLPITEALPALLAALAANRNAVLVAPPGAGKTTIVPLALLDAPWRGDARILVLEPRRLATRAAAARMASLLGEQVGQTVGYRTRLDSAVSQATRIEVITEGLLVRRLLSDPGLDGVAAVLLDEVHERSLDSDLALALCCDLQRMLRPELRLLAMSATPDAARLAALLGAPTDAPIASQPGCDMIESAGRMFPVTVTHAGRDLAHPRDLPDVVARAVRAALAEHAGDILAFLPGMAEIRRAQAALDRCGALVLPLHGELPPSEQDRALRPADTRRVVLATSIAETSLTVPGVRVVVDGGWRRAPRLDQSTGLTSLATLRISRAAAEQRAGRAGREAPGVAIRLWTPALHRGLTAFDRPEILEAELSSLALTCAAWGTPPAALAFPDPPPSGALAAAEALLRELGAVDAAGSITATGRRMAQVGAHPRLAAMLLAAESDSEVALAADLAALLEERDPLRGPPNAPGTSADIASRVAAVADGDPAADRGALARIHQAATQYRRRLHLPADTRPSGDPGRLLAAGFPDRIAQRRGEPMPPIDVYRVGDMHFVIDGHHRVSIAIATGATTIEAHVTEVLTQISPTGIRGRRDLLVKSYERIFRARVPLPAADLAKITVTDPWSYAELGEAVEAWGFRYMQDKGKFLDRAAVARHWYADEYVPVVRMMRAADLIGSRTEAEAYMRVAAERYRLIMTHDWNDEIIERLRRKIR